MSVLYPKSLLWVLGPGKQCCPVSLLLVLVMLPSSQAKHTSRVKHCLSPIPKHVMLSQVVSSSLGTPQRTRQQPWVRQLGVQPPFMSGEAEIRGAWQDPALYGSCLAFQQERSQSGSGRSSAPTRPGKSLRMSTLAKR